MNSGCLRPVLWVSLKQQIKKTPKPVAVGQVRRDRVWSAVCDLVVDLLKFHSRKRLFQSAKLINYASKSPNVDLSILRLLIPDFRRDVVDGTALGMFLDLLFRCEALLNSVVTDLERVAINKDIFRLEVVMDDVFEVQVGEC
jgi:hypothetical protein